MSSFGIGNLEILSAAESVAKEKGISKEAVIEAMEQSIQAAGRKKYGQEHNIYAQIDSKNGEIKLYRELQVVESVEDNFKQILLIDAKHYNPEIKLGEIIRDPLPPIDLGRVAAQAAKQVIVQKVHSAERERQYDDFKTRIGEIANGIVKRIEYGNVTIELGKSEAVIDKRHIIPNEMFHKGDRIRAYIVDVRRENKGPQIFLSRTANEFLIKLFIQEVPEIYSKSILIKAVAREPGSRAKMAVYSSDNSIDPVIPCVGVKGSRVIAVMNELQGEKIDIVKWSAEPAIFVVNALSPAEVSKVVIDEDKRRIEVVVPSDQLSRAIGRRGQNVRLASQLTGWNIDVLTEDQESKRRIDEFNNTSELFINALDVEEVLANLLAAEGFNSIEDIALIELNELVSIEGFDEQLAQELISRAQNYLLEKNNQLEVELTNLGFEPTLRELLELPYPTLINMANEGIKSLDDLADLSLEELKDIINIAELSDEFLGDLIMKARNIVYK